LERTISRSIGREGQECEILGHKEKIIVKTVEGVRMKGWLLFYFREGGKLLGGGRFVPDTYLEGPHIPKSMGKMNLGANCEGRKEGIRSCSHRGTVRGKKGSLFGP